MTRRSTNLPTCEKLLPAFAGVPHTHHLRRWGGSDWDVIVGFPEETIRGRPSVGELRRALARMGAIARVDPELDLPPFTSGWLGYVGYEYAKQIDPSLAMELDDFADDIYLGYYHGCLATHTPSGKTYCFATSEEHAEALEATFRMLYVQHLSRDVEPLAEAPFTTTHATTALSTAASFERGVTEVREAILAGDVFQANLTRCIELHSPAFNQGAAICFAGRLFAKTDAPFAALLQFMGTTIVSASPERFFCVEVGSQGLRVVAEPIKGTRPRSADAAEDARLAAELLASEKDRAENVMIADLVRNDLSRVCLDESITVERLCELRSFASVHHLVTTVSGVLRPGLTAVDALLAQFPCGSITGAPKAAAMDLISRLEQRQRGVYCGSIGFFDDRGHADFSVAIRTAAVSFGLGIEDHGGDAIAKGAGVLRYGVGGGITTLSDPAEEFRETEHKAADLRGALRP